MAQRSIQYVTILLIVSGCTMTGYNPALVLSETENPVIEQNSPEKVVEEPR